AGMGALAAELDDDRDFDLFVTNLVDETDSFYRNDKGLFRDRTATAGLGVTARPFTRFGAGFYDFDQDGLLDLYVAAGRVARGTAPTTSDMYAEENLLFRGAAPGRFEGVRPPRRPAKAVV